MAEMGDASRAISFGFYDPDQPSYPEEVAGDQADLVVRYGGAFIHRADRYNPEGWYSATSSEEQSPSVATPVIEFTPGYAQPIIDIDQNLMFVVTPEIAREKSSISPSTLRRLMKELEPRHLVYTTPRHATSPEKAYGININAVPEILGRVEEALTEIPRGTNQYPAGALVLDSGTKGNFRSLFTEAIQPPAPDRTPPASPTIRQRTRGVEPGAVQTPAPAPTEQLDSGITDQEIFKRSALAGALISSGLTGMVIESAILGGSATQNTIGGMGCAFVWGATGVLYYFSKQ